MAIAVEGSAISGSNKTAGTSILSSSYPHLGAGSLPVVGDLLVASIVWDGIPTARSCKDNGTGLEWIGTEFSTTDPGGQFTCVYYAMVTTNVAWNKVNFAWTGSITAKAYILETFSGVSSAAPANSSSSSGAAAIALAAGGSPASGNLLYGVGGFNGPSGNALGDDTDTVDGSWVTGLKTGTTGGSGNSNATIFRQYKILTGSSSQTWNVSNAASMNYGAALLEFTASGGSPPSNKGLLSLF